MEKDNKDRQLFDNWAQVIRSAKKGVPRRTLAARCGMSVRQFNAVIETRPDLELAIEQAYADYDEEQRDGLGEVLVEAKSEKNWSLAAKILRENQKELNERDKNNRIADAVENFGSRLVEPEYGVLSAEEQAAIREQTEEADRASWGSDDE